MPCHGANRYTGTDDGETERHRSGLVTTPRHSQAQHSTAHEKDARASKPGAPGTPARSLGGTRHRGPPVTAERSDQQHPQEGLRVTCRRLLLQAVSAGGPAAPRTSGRPNGAPEGRWLRRAAGELRQATSAPAALPAAAGMRRLGRRPRPREPESRRPPASRGRLFPPTGSALGSFQALHGGVRGHRRCSGRRDERREPGMSAGSQE